MARELVEMVEKDNQKVNEEIEEWKRRQLEAEAAATAAEQPAAEVPAAEAATSAVETPPASAESSGATMESSSMVEETT